MLPKLEECIREERALEKQRKLWQRARARRAELQRVYREYITGLADSETQTLPPLCTLEGFEEIDALIKADDYQTTITIERLETVLPSVFAAYASTLRSNLLKAVEEACKPVIGSFRLEALLGQECLDFAFCLYSCSWCKGPLPESVYSYRELLAHIHDTHMFDSWRPSAYRIDGTPSLLALTILSELGISEDISHADISGKVVCMCAKPGFSQPSAFSKLVHPRFGF